MQVFFFLSSFVLSHVSKETAAADSKCSHFTTCTAKIQLHNTRNVLCLSALRRHVLKSQIKKKNIWRLDEYIQLEIEVD